MPAGPHEENSRFSPGLRILEMSSWPSPNLGGDPRAQSRIEVAKGFCIRFGSWRRLPHGRRGAGADPGPACRSAMSEAERFAAVARSHNVGFSCGCPWTVVADIHDVQPFHPFWARPRVSVTQFSFRASSRFRMRPGVAEGLQTKESAESRERRRRSGRTLSRKSSLEAGETRIVLGPPVESARGDDARLLQGRRERSCRKHERVAGLHGKRRFVAFALRFQCRRGGSPAPSIESGRSE